MFSIFLNFQFILQLVTCPIDCVGRIARGRPFERIETRKRHARWLQEGQETFSIYLASGQVAKVELTLLFGADHRVALAILGVGFGFDISIG